jgi:hypothetical protein
MIDFVWRVPTAGYRWCRRDGEDLVEVADDAPSDPAAREFLVPVTDGKFRDALPDDAPDCALLMFRDTRPLRDHTGLFREFAATKRTRAAIKDFANRYGNLGELDALGERNDRSESIEPPGWVETMEDYAEWERTTQGEYRRADSRALWGAEIERMRRCVATWGAARKMETQERGAQVTQVINNALFEHRVGAALADGPRKARDPRKRVALQFVPVSLVGALWAQFAQAVVGNYDHWQCAECGEWFAVSPEASRTSRAYCGDACRARHYRAKKASARRLHRAGGSLAAIAEELGTDVVTLKGWLKPGGT